MRRILSSTTKNPESIPLCFFNAKPRISEIWLCACVWRSLAQTDAFRMAYRGVTESVASNDTFLLKDDDLKTVYEVLMVFRFVAAVIYDWVIAFVLLLAFTAICLLISNNNAITPGTLWYQTGLVLNVLLYYLISVKYGGQTIGMRAFHLKIVSEGSRLTVLQIITRLVLTLPAYLTACFLFSTAQNRLVLWTKTRLIYQTPNQA